MEAETQSERLRVPSAGPAVSRRIGPANYT
jgi:hypothetical protein